MERTDEVHACLPISGSSLSPTLSPFCLPQAWDLPSSILIGPDSNLETDLGGKERESLLRSWRKVPEEGAAISAPPAGGGKAKRGFQKLEDISPLDTQIPCASTHTSTQWLGRGVRSGPDSLPGGQLSAVCKLGCPPASGGIGHTQGSPKGNETESPGWTLEVLFAPPPTLSFASESL